jgi:hypothetical protein
MQLSIGTNYSLAVKNDYMIIKATREQPIVTMSVNGASMNFGHGSNLIGRGFARCNSKSTD